VSDAGRAVDTSVVIAGLCSWHPDHELARRHLAARPVGILHVVTEAYSVITRLPGNRKVAPDIAHQAIASVFQATLVALPESAVLPLLGRLAESGVHGGATYDAIVGETARLAGLTLTSLDIRAQRTYAAVGVAVDLL
jgi:predicted nucleic acid-binding protein